MRLLANPELVRHWRMELRPRRVIAVIGVVVVLCTVGLLLASYHPEGLRGDAITLYYGLLAVHYGALMMWSAGACGDALVRERAEKTIDAWRTTRLSAGELIVGILLGRPALIAVGVAASLPVVALLAYLADVPARAVILTYAFLPVVTALSGLLGLWLSLTLTRAGSGALAAFVVLIFPAYGFPLLASPLVGLATLGVWPVVSSFHPGATLLERPTMLGVSVPWVVAAVVVYLGVGAWLVRMLRQNLKREVEDMQLLSRRDAVLFALYVNLMFVVFLDPVPRPMSVTSLAMAQMLNVGLLYLVGVLILAPRPRLLAWWRGVAGARRWVDLAEDGLPWPWMVLVAAAAYLTLVGAGAAGLLGGPVPPGDTAARLAIATVFAVRDVTFLQWCRVTALKRPVMVGVFVLYLVYVLVLAVGSAPFWSHGDPREWLALPYNVLNVDLSPAGLAVRWTVLQIAVILLLLADIRRRLERPMRVPARGM
jgi:hypothetical protein